MSACDNQVKAKSLIDSGDYNGAVNRKTHQLRADKKIFGKICSNSLRSADVIKDREYFAKDCLMRVKPLLLTSVILGLAPCLFAQAQDDGAVEVYARGDYAGAVRLLEPKYRAEAINIQERLILGRAYRHFGRMDDALAVLKSVLDIDRENPEANRLTGTILNESGRSKQALEYLKQAWQLKQDAATAGTLGQCYYALGELTRARVYLEKALSEDIRDPTNSFVLGRICLQRGLGALAERYLLKAEEAGMVSPEMYHSLGRAYLLQRKYVGPILVRRLSEPAMPGDIVDDFVVLAQIADAPGRYRVCTRDCALYEGYRLLRAQPNSIDARYMLTAGWLAAGNRNLAGRYLSQLPRQEKVTARAAELQAELLLTGKEYTSLEKALEAGYEKKLFDAEKTAAFYYRAAMMLRAEGSRQEAVRMLRKAESHTPTSSPVLRSLAALHLGSARRNEARLYYARLVELFPDAHDIDELRNTLRVLRGQVENQE
ncbi:MAG: tetratricopeptide repeat protein [Planctomycetota bacterium]